MQLRRNDTAGSQTRTSWRPSWKACQQVSPRLWTGRRVLVRRNIGFVCLFEGNLGGYFGIRIIATEFRFEKLGKQRNNYLRYPMFFASIGQVK
ncbi:hypothetical protein VTK26DRAFT_7133 [Humicola hyalothermophila]